MTTSDRALPFLCSRYCLQGFKLPIWPLGLNHTSGNHTPGTSGVIGGANSCFRNQNDPLGLTVTS